MNFKYNTLHIADDVTQYAPAMEPATKSRASNISITELGRLASLMFKTWERWFTDAIEVY